MKTFFFLVWSSPNFGPKTGLIQGGEILLFVFIIFKFPVFKFPGPLTDEQGALGPLIDNQGPQGP